jgi:uncharacterized protein (DUF1697 family)
MRTYISILRGINVGGNRIIKMEALREMYEEMGFENIQSYIQSGNVIFQYKDSKTNDLASKVSHQIAARFGFEVPVILMELNELETLVSENPFAKETNRDISFMHLTFLSEIPDPEKFGKISNEYRTSDEYRYFDKVIYLYCPNGYGKTMFTNGFFEKILDVTATTRNWKTALELLNMARKTSAR